jgi:predicted enzyme related to lactoylglutathione lyase
MSNNPVVHFEMPYKDGKRVSKFYKSAFNWGMNDAGPGMGNYIVAATTPLDKKTNRPKARGEINGGFYQKSKSSNPYPSFVISVEDIKKAIALVKKSGGKVVGKVQDIPGIGLWIVFKDTEGNKVSMLQAKM